MTKIEKRLQAAKSMRQLANDLRTPHVVIQENAVHARMAEAIAVLLEELP